MRAKRFGELLVPAEPRYVQAVKMGGKEVDELVLADIAADVINQMEDGAVHHGLWQYGCLCDGRVSSGQYPARC